MLQKGMPSQPVRIFGFKSLPKAGDPIMCVESEEIAEELVERRIALESSSGDRPDARKDVEIQIPGMRSRDAARLGRVQKVIDKAGIEGSSDGMIRIPVVVKADADGSLSAVRESLINMGNNSKHNVIIDPISEGVGPVTASDIQLAKESDAAIFVFGLKIDQATLNQAEAEEVVLRSNDIIYSLLDEAKKVYGAYLPRIRVEHVHGKAKVQAIFIIDGDDGKESVAGLQVLDGSLYKDKVKINNDKLQCHFRVLRGGKQITPEEVLIRASSLRHVKELVESVRRGDECGLALSGFSDFEAGDVVECYSIEMQIAPF
jgi:translation initiation factor IF-2